MSTEQAPESGSAPGLESIVSRRARGLLGELQMTQSQLAMRLGISRSGMSLRLNGSMEFALSELSGLAAALDTTAEYLLGFTERREPLATSVGQGLSGDSVRHQGLEPRTR